jgi:hypothetical protein
VIFSFLENVVLFFFSDAFAKLEEASINFVMSVRSSASTGRIFHEICYVLFPFRKSVAKIHVSLKSDKNNWYLT